MRLTRSSTAVPTPGGRLGGSLVCAGALLTLTLGLTIPSYSNGHPAEVTIPSLIALLLGAVCVFLGKRTPLPLVATMPTLAALLIAWSMWSSDTPQDGSEMLYVWCVFFAAYVLPPVVALTNTLVIVTTYAVVVVDARGVTDGAPPAIELTATLVIACLLISQLRLRSAESLDEARTEARTDVLTGLLNRRGLSELSLRECERAERDGRPLAAWMVDLDRFKQLNDALGHAAGDRALASVAEVLRGQLRGIDVIARVGGEEFCVLLPNCTTGDAFLRAECVREAIAYEFREWELPVTVSIGVAAWSAGDSDGTQMVDAADEALYTAKSGGRNQTQVSHGRRPSGLAVTEAR